MIEKDMTLTPNDKILLNSYKILTEGLGLFLGEGYEIILHSLENLQCSVIQIVNGYHSGRSVGAPITDFALSMLKNIDKNKKKVGITYFNKSRTNTILKSCTIPIVGERERIIGLLCINFYTDISFFSFVSGFMPAMQAAGKSETPIETFFDSSEDLITTAFNEEKEAVFRNPAISANNKNKEIIIRLEQRGIFHIKDAVNRVATLLQISRNTVYLHLRNHKKEC